MKCAVHPDAEAVGYCRNCGKAMCALCVRPVRDVLYCEDCLATLMGIPAQNAAPPAVSAASSSQGSAGDVPPTVAPPAPAPPQGMAVRRASHPGLAFILGLFFPGLGAVYNGQYNKALLQIVIFVGIIIGLSSDADGGFKAILGVGLGVYMVYMAIDAMRVARERAAGGVITADPLDNWSKDRPVGPIILIVVGVILLLNQFDWFPWYRVGQLWPIILIVVGVLLFRNRLAGR